MPFNKEMQDALKADAQKLRDLGAPIEDPLFIGGTDPFFEAFEPMRGDARSAACLDHELAYGTELE